jgi:adenine-specific DNA methylase
MNHPNNGQNRRLIEEWLPIAEIGVESLRERTPMTPFPAPNRLHVWFARRPLVASRAAVLASLLPADADRAKFLHVLGIHGDPMHSRSRIAEAKRTGVRFEGEAYTYPRAFSYTPNDEDREWIASQTGQIVDGRPITVLDPTAGGGSIPFEAMRLGFNTIANDLNPVAWLILKATVELPAKFGPPLLKRYRELAAEFVRRRDERLAPFFPPEPEPDCVATNWLWARTIRCPYCDGVVPLSPNWKLDGKGTGVRVVPHVDDPAHRHCTFEIVTRAKDHSPGTVKAGDALCPYPDCGRVIDGDEHVKPQAQAGGMGQQLYAVVFKRNEVFGYTANGKPKVKSTRGFRAPRPEDDVEDRVREAFEVKRPEWEARNVVPTEERYDGYSDRCIAYGVRHHTGMYSGRQLFGHCTSVEVYQEILEECQAGNEGALTGIDEAALVYLAIAIDKMLDYNSKGLAWHANREVLEHTFHLHMFLFKQSFAEMAPCVTGVGYDWVTRQVGKCLEELMTYAGGPSDDRLIAPPHQTAPSLMICCGSGDTLGLADGSVDGLVIDPPYYDNVIYSELSDYFYVWLKRTAGLIYPEQFQFTLTDKDREAIANPAKFAGQKGAKELAGLDYEERMAAIFAECRRVLKPDGIMVVMFTHKASGAWDALASGLVRAGFVITASWPVNTEAEGSLHIKEKSAARSTIFLVCRAREGRHADADAVYWEDVEPRVAEKVGARIGEFQAAGIGGIDLYLASFGPALQVFSESWPLTRGRPVTRPNGKSKKGKVARPGDDDPYAVRPEDALDAARREVKRWRMDQLATVKRQHHLDPVTEWFVLAWDAFKAPRFPVDEALKLARVVGLDFDREVKNHVCEVKSSDVTLWDSVIRQRKGKLGPVGGPVVLDTLHQCAALGREQNTGVAQAALEEADLLNDATLMTALEALLNVLPYPAQVGKGKPDEGGLSGSANDFDALERLRKLAFADLVPRTPRPFEAENPATVQTTLFADDEASEDGGGGEELDFGDADDE